MKRVAFYAVCAILLGLPFKIQAQPCNVPYIYNPLVTPSFWEVNVQGDLTDTSWQVVVVKTGGNPDKITDWISTDTAINYGSGTGTAMSNSPLPLNTACYCYARNLCGASPSNWSVPIFIINKASAPISNLQAAYIGDGEVKVTWDGIMAYYYSVFQYNYQTGKKDTLAMSYPGNTTNSYYTFPGGPGTYYYEVFSMMTGDSAFSNLVEYSNCITMFSNAYDTVPNTIILYADTFYANKFYWDYGDGSVSNIYLSQHKHSYAREGIYNVCLTVRDTVNGCNSQFCQKIAVGKNISIIEPNFTPYNDSGFYYTFYNTTQPIDSLDFYWTFGDGKTSFELQPQHDYAKAGVYNVCLTATQQRTKQSVSICQQVKVGSTGCDLSASFNYKIVGTTNDTVQFTNFSTGSIANYYWYFDDGTVSTDTSPSHHFDKKGEHVVLLIISDLSWNCSDYAELNIQVGSSDCKADFEYSVGINDSTVTLNNKSGGDIAKYYWSFGDGIFSTDESTIHTYKNKGLYSVSLVVENAVGTCMDKIEKEVQVGEIGCSARFSYVVDMPTLTVYCKNEAIGDATRYYWSFGDGSFSEETNPVHQFKYPGYYTIGLNTYNSITWCMDNYETTVLVGSESIVCKPDFFYNVDPGTREVRFKDNSIGSTKDYIWDFGDNIISNFKDTTSHIYPHGGYYDVCLTVTNESDVPNMICKWIEVAPDPKTNCYADFNVSEDSANKTVSLVSQSLGDPVNFTWDLGDGSTSNQKDSLNYTYTIDNYYLISLHITTATGCESFGYKLINIGQPYGLYAKFGYDPKHYNAKAGGYPVDFGGAGLGDNSRLRWNFGDGSVNSTNMSPTHVYTDPGKYWVCLTVADTVTHEESEDCDSVSTQTMCQNDSIDPVAKCKNISINITGSFLDISPLDVNNNSTDDCAIADYSLDNKRFVPANEGANLVHLTVTDYNNNTSTCSAIVTVSVSSDISSISEYKTDLTVSPNPLRNLMTVKFQLPVSCATELAIYDLLGKRVATISTLKFSSGSQVLTYDASRLKSGSYILQLKTSTGITNRQVFIKQ